MTLLLISIAIIVLGIAGYACARSSANRDRMFYEKDEHCEMVETRKEFRK